MAYLLPTAVGITLAFAFINGFHDGCNAVATIIGSRSMHPRRAIALAALAVLVGTLMLGTAVANTVASSILRVDLLARLSPEGTCLVVIAAAGGAIVWNLATWLLGMPSSSSHALIGGLVGAGSVALEVNAAATHELILRVVLPLLLCPLVSGLVAYVLFAIIREGFSGFHPSVHHFFVTLQKPALVLLAASHGSNDAQKSMGLIGLVLATGGVDDSSALRLPSWVVGACAVCLALGLLAGGWRIIKTVGFDIFRMRPVHSFTSQVSSAAVVLTASLFGWPLSTTQVVASSVIGVGASRRLSGVRWNVTRNIAYSWIFTLPAAGAVGAGTCWVLRRLLEP